MGLVPPDSNRRAPARIVSDRSQKAPVTFRRKGPEPFQCDRDSPEPPGLAQRIARDRALPDV